MIEVTYYAVTCKKDNTVTTAHIFDNPADANRTANLLNSLFKDRLHTAIERQAVLSDAMLVKHKQALLASKEALQDLNEKAKVFNSKFNKGSK